MNNRMKPMIAAALMITFGTLSPILLAQDQQPNSRVPRDIPSSTPEGKILWQYNTHG